MPPGRAVRADSPASAAAAPLPPPRARATRPRGRGGAVGRRALTSSLRTSTGVLPKLPERAARRRERDRLAPDGRPGARKVGGTLRGGVPCSMAIDLPSSNKRSKQQTRRGDHAIVSARAQPETKNQANEPKQYGLEPSWQRTDPTVGVCVWHGRIRGPDPGPGRPGLLFFLV